MVAACRALLLCAAWASALALEAKWTPAADGGPSRFSKRYRDSIGQDDSRWTNDGAQSSSWAPQLLPQSTSGWIAGVACIAGILYFRGLGQPAGERVGGAAGAGAAGAGAGAALPWGRPAPNAAGEAARAAFLRKYDS